MRILISLNSAREIKNILLTPFFEYIKKDIKNEYLIFSSFAKNEEFCHLTNSENIKNLPFPEHNKFKCFFYFVFLNKLFEYYSLYQQSSPDQVIFFERLKKYFTKDYYKGFVLALFFKIFPNFLINIIYSYVFNNPFYTSLDVDKALVSVYHSWEERQIVHTLKGVPIIFFCDGWDAFTKQTFYERKPDLTLCWDHNMKVSAKKNCQLLNVHVIGNPFFDVINSYQPTYKKTENSLSVLFFGGNRNVFNELKIAELFYETCSLSDENFAVRTSPGFSFLNREKRDFYLEKIGKENVYTPLDYWSDKEEDIEKNIKSLKSGFFEKEYLELLYNFDCFVVLGPSTLLFDIMLLNKIIILVHVEEDKKGVWDWSLTKDREVLRSLEKYQFLISCNSLNEISSSLDKARAMKQKNNEEKRVFTSVDSSLRLFELVRSEEIQLA